MIITPMKYIDITGTPVCISGLITLSIQVGFLRKSLTLAIMYNQAESIIVIKAYQGEFIESFKYGKRQLKLSYTRVGYHTVQV